VNEILKSQLATQFARKSPWRLDCWELLPARVSVDDGVASLCISYPAVFPLMMHLLFMNVCVYCGVNEILGSQLATHFARENHCRADFWKWIYQLALPLMMVSLFMYLLSWGVARVRLLQNPGLTIVGRGWEILKSQKFSKVSLNAIYRVNAPSPEPQTDHCKPWVRNSQKSEILKSQSGRYI